jgi:hypothetical protein
VRISYLKLKFKILKFRFNEKLFLEKENFTLSKFLLFGFIKNIIRSIFFVMFLFIIEYYLQQLYDGNIKQLSKKLIKAIDLIPKPTYPKSDDSVTQFISLIASVSGVLLALFYPILATIASTGYAKVNSSIRNLIFIEPVTQNYLKQLAFLTAYSILTLLFITFGYNPGNLVLSILLFLSLSSLFSLLQIGAGVYNLFEPDTLIRIVNKEIKSDIKNVTISSVYWENENFQKYFRTKTEKNIEKVRLIMELSIDSVTINKQSFLNTVTLTYSILNYYLINKNRIPIKSKWFKNRNYHESFFETSDHIRQLSTSTNTYIQSKTEANKSWFEDEIFEILNVFGEKMTPHINHEIKTEFLLKSSNTLQYFGNNFELDFANKLITGNLSLIEKSLIVDTTKSYQLSKSNLALAEGFIRSIVAFQISYFNTIEYFSVEKINTEISKINWNKKESLYKTELPKQLYKVLEKYYDNIKNEIYVDGKKITPDWYILQHLSAEYLILVDKTFIETLNQIDEFIISLINTAKANDDSLLVSFICHLAYELIHKIEFRVARTIEILEKYNQNNLYKGEFRWKEIDRDGIKQRATSLREKIITEISDNIEKIYTVKWSEDYPDVFGQSFSILSNEISNCYINKDLSKFEILLKPFIKSSLGGFYSIYDRNKGKYIYEYEIIYQLHIELFQISGLSYIYSVLTGIPFWEKVVEIWDGINITKPELDVFMGSYIFYKNHKFSTGHNFHDNLNRSKLLSNFVKENAIDISEFKNNLIVKYLRSETINNNDYEEIFIELYLFTFIFAKENASSLSLTRRRDLFEKIIHLSEENGE